MRSFSYLIIAGSIVLILCCIPTTAYASPDDELAVRIYPPNWPQPYPVLYPSLSPFEPLDIDGGQLNIEDIEHVELQLLPQQPRFNGVPLIDVGGSLFDSYGFSDSSYEPAYSTIVVPEPATLLLLGYGRWLLIKRKP